MLHGLRVVLGAFWISVLRQPQGLGLMAVRPEEQEQRWQQRYGNSRDAGGAGEFVALRPLAWSSMVGC